MSNKHYTDTEQIYINDAADQLGRRPATIRDWERRGLLPKYLMSNRNDRGWRFWTPKQIEGLKAWMERKDMRPGKGLPHYKPDAATVVKHIQGQRKPRKKTEPPIAA